MTNVPLSRRATCPARGIGHVQEPWFPPRPYAADRIVGEGVPPSVGRDARCLLAQMSCFKDRGTEMLILLIHCSSNFAVTAPGLVGDSEKHRTWPLPAGLEWEELGQVQFTGAGTGMGKPQLRQWGMHGRRGCTHEKSHHPTPK